MHDIRFIRDNANTFDAAMARRGLAGENGTSLSGQILELDAKVREAVAEKQAAETLRNTASKQIGRAKASGDEAEAQRLMAEVGEAKATIEAAGEREAEATAARDALLLGLPNMLADTVPDGEDEDENVEVRRWGTPAEFSFAPKSHDEIGEALTAGGAGSQMDFERAAKMSGARFVALKGPLARLERALGEFMLSHQTGEGGYLEVSPPLLTNDAAMLGTDKLPKFADDLFQTTDGRWLIPTAEVSLTCLVMDMILEEGQLPLRFTAQTPCFRSEAGSAGRDTRGMIRQHQFKKVELVSVTRPEDSEAEHERMTDCAEKVLQALELPYRVMALCAGDIGFGARRTYDLEVWLPSQGAYREISSCSTTGDFQARRMNARFRRAGEKKPEFVHTLNGSGLAVGRTLVAVLENYQQEDGSVVIPEALRPFMDGLDRIESI